MRDEVQIYPSCKNSHEDLVSHVVQEEYDILECDII
jgi:hypothetical protein